jgi:pyrroloquinoline quinone biosynthesis protein D
MSENTQRLHDSAELNAVPRVSHPFRLQWEKAQNAYVLLYPEGMVKLNDSAGHILTRCDGERSVDAVITELSQAFPAAEDIDKDILAFLSDAHSQGWISYDS